MDKADKNTLAYALCCAIEERDSYASAYNYTGPEAEKAIADVARFEALHVKLIGCESAISRSNRELAGIPTVSLYDLVSFRKKP